MDSLRERIETLLFFAHEQFSIRPPGLNSLVAAMLADVSMFRTECSLHYVGMWLWRNDFSP